MAAGGSEWVARAKKFREVNNFEEPQNSSESVAEILDRVAKFLRDHETPVPNDATHNVFDNYPDWWMSGAADSSYRPAYKLAIAEDNTVTTLYKCIADCYNLGIPLTLQEKRGSMNKLMQDIKIWGTKDHIIRCEELMCPQGPFIRALGKVMGVIYPEALQESAEENQPFLDCAIYDSTGVSVTKGINKTSIRIVWPSLVVDRVRAAKINDYTVVQFKESQDPELQEISRRALEMNQSENTWDNVFYDNLSSSRYGIRMPLCDRVSPAPLKKPEKRPFKPFGILRLYFDKDGEEAKFVRAETVATPGDDSIDTEQWISIGTIRTAAGTDPTQWKPPPYAPPARSNRPLAAGENRAEGLDGGALGARRPGAARIRSTGGSDNRPVRQGPRSENEIRAEPQRNVTRHFIGDIADFKDQITRTMGTDQSANFQESDGVLIWQQPNDSGRIELQAATGRVIVTGRSHQVRSIVMMIAGFVQAANDTASTVASGAARSTATRSRMTRPGSQTGAGSSAFAPSRAGYAPSLAYAPAPSQAGSTMSTTSIRTGVQGDQRRVAISEFEPQSQTELRLNMGDVVVILHDPERREANAHRWVHGRNETTQEDGWFPFSSTDVFQD